MAGVEHRGQTLDTFLEVTGVTDRAQAQRVLEENNWDLDVSFACLLYRYNYRPIYRGL